MYVCVILLCRITFLAFNYYMYAFTDIMEIYIYYNVYADYLD